MKTLKFLALFCVIALLSVSCEKKEESPLGKLAVSNRATAELYIHKISLYVGTRPSSYTTEPKAPGDVEYFDLLIDQTYNVEVYASEKSDDPQSSWVLYKSSDQNIQLTEYKQASDIKILSFPDDFKEP